MFVIRSELLISGTLGTRRGRGRLTVDESTCDHRGVLISHGMFSSCGPSKHEGRRGSEPSRQPCGRTPRLGSDGGGAGFLQPGSVAWRRPELCVNGQKVRIYSYETEEQGRAAAARIDSNDPTPLSSGEATPGSGTRVTPGPLSGRRSVDRGPTDVDYRSSVYERYGSGSRSRRRRLLTQTTRATAI